MPGFQISFSGPALPIISLMEGALKRLKLQLNEAMLADVSTVFFSSSLTEGRIPYPGPEYTATQLADAFWRLRARNREDLEAGSKDS